MVPHVKNVMLASADQVAIDAVAARLMGFDPLAIKYIRLAHDAGVPLARITPATTGRLESLLDPGLPPVNPLDAWSTGGPDYHVGMQQCFAALMADPNAALGAVVHDRISGGLIQDSYIDYLRAGHAASGKPAFLDANRQGTGFQLVSVSGQAMRVLQLARLEKVFAIHDDLDAAMVAAG